MKIENCIALVTGANRGLGKAYCDALLAAGAKKIYAGSRDPAAITDKRLIPVKLDVTSAADIAAAAKSCGDVTLLINNAGILLGSPMLAEGAADKLRRELEVNVFGVLGMTGAFAPILIRNGGGTIANMLSVASWFTPGPHATYATSKHAALAVTEGSRIQLRSQGVHVVGVFAGYIDTDMAASIDMPKVSPQLVAEKTLDAIRNGEDEAIAGESAQNWHARRDNPEGIRTQMQQIWDAMPKG